MNQKKPLKMEKPFDGGELMTGHSDGGFLSTSPRVAPKTGHTFIRPLVTRGSGLSKVGYLSSGVF